MVRPVRRLVGVGPLVACSLVACEPHPARLVQRERRGVRATVGEPGCEPIALPEGAITQTFAGMGLSGWRRVRTIFSDGRVTQDDSSGPPHNGLRLSVARLRKLDADLVATGLFDQAESCWWRGHDGPPEAWSDDYVPPGITVRHDGRVYTYKGNPEVFPEVVAKAQRLFDSLDTELDAQGG